MAKMPIYNQNDSRKQLNYAERTHVSEALKKALASMGKPKTREARK